MKIRPMNGRVVVKPVEPKKETKEGIVIPDTAKKKPVEGRVVAVAEDTTEEVAIGDRIIYAKYGGTEIEMDGENFVLLLADDLLAKYQESDAIPE